MYVSAKDSVDGNIIEFNILYAKDKSYEEIGRLYKSLEHYCNLGYGAIYKSNLHHSYWYLNPEETLATLISADRLAVILQWDKQTLLCNKLLVDKIVNIGGIPSSPYTSYEAYLEFPCRVKIKTGEWLDHCIIHFSKRPPTQSYFKKIIFLDDVIDVEPSEFSLSHELRLASTLSSEIRMGFSPFTVKTKDDKLITYNGVTQFASEGAIKGDDIVCEAGFSYDTFNGIKDVPYEAITYVIGKWDDGFTELFNEYRERQDRMSTPNGLLKLTPFRKTIISIKLFFWECVNKILG